MGASDLALEITESKSLRIGYCHTPGRKTDSEGCYVMEDMLLIRGCFRGRSNEDLIGVFDGHCGSQMAEYTARNFHQVLQEELCLFESLSEEDTQQVANSLERQTNFIEIDPPCANLSHKRVAWAIHSTFHRITEAIRQLNLEQGEGTTALVALFLGPHLYVANVGDTRCVAGKENGDSIRLSVDHRPVNEERERVERAGGKVINFSVPRVEGLLAVTRSLGDFDMADKGIIFNPHIKVIENFRDSISFVTLATDGLWDLIADYEAVDVVWTEFTKKSNKPSSTATVASNEPYNLMFDLEEDEVVSEKTKPCPRLDNALEMQAAKTLVNYVYRRHVLDNVSVVVVSWPSDELA